jgi:hypothetical protein
MRSTDTRAAQPGKDAAEVTPAWGPDDLGQVLELVPDPVVAFDAVGTIVYWSTAARERYGYSAEEAVGQRGTLLLHTRFPLPLLEMVEELADLGQWTGHIVHVDRWGREHAMESRCVARYDDAGRFIGGIGIERPIGSAPADGPGPAGAATRSVAEWADPVSPGPSAPPATAVPETEHRRAERLAGLGQLVGGIAHDFNNALGIVINYAAFVAGEIERLRTAPDEQQRATMRADLQEVQSAAERAANLTHQLLDFARRESGAARTADLNALITDLHAMLSQTVGPGISLVTKLAEDLHLVRIDSSQLQQLLVNVTVNARDAMADGGQLTIDTANVAVDADTAQVGPDLQAGAYVRLRVSDTGCGMTPEVVAQAFDPFFTTKSVGQGAGLGLSSVYGIVTGAGGHARFYSERGVGTTFEALLPAIGPSPEEAPVMPRAERPRTRGEHTILLAEDERALREVAERILVDAGYRVIAAADGMQALQAAEGHDGPIDLLLTDVVMPGLLGTELADQLRARRPQMGVLYMSGFSESILGASAPIDPRDLIDKPFTAPTLLLRVEAALAATRTGAP